MSLVVSKYRNDLSQNEKNMNLQTHSRANIDVVIQKHKWWKPKLNEKVESNDVEMNTMYQIFVDVVKANYIRSRQIRLKVSV